MKMPKYLDRGTDGFHKSCLCSDCIYRTDVYIHTYTYAARHVSTDSVVNVTRGGDWIFRWLASLLSLTFPKSFFPTRTHAVVLHIVDSSDGDSKEFPSDVQLFKVSLFRVREFAWGRRKCVCIYICVSLKFNRKWVWRIVELKEIRVKFGIEVAFEEGGKV